jgi:Tfp pilus assembly protein PilN
VLNRQISDWEAKIEKQKGSSQKAIALYTQFQAEQKKVAEVQTFLGGERLVYTQYLARLAEVLPKSVAVTFIDYTTSRVVLRGIVNGEPDQASGIASAFERQLKEDPSFSKQFNSIALTTLARDQQSGRLTFEIAMKFEETGKKK